jgi:DegV family protein with EDD domain
MKLGFVTDSTADLPQQLVEVHGIEVVPALLIIEGESYADGQGISREAYYARLPHMQVPPSTAAPSVGEFAQRFQKLIEAGCEHILSIHAAHQLTNIVNAARLAARSFGERITVVDSSSLTLGMGFQVLAAVEAAALDMGLPGILQEIKSVRARLQVLAALDTMEYLRRSGRVPATVAALGGVLQVKPLVELRDGEVKPLGAVRTTRQGGMRLLQALQTLGPLERLAILHTNAEARARQLIQDLMATVNQSVPRDILMVNVTTVIGTHVGPNGLGFAAVRARADSTRR